MRIQMSQRPPVTMTRMKSRIKPSIPLLGFDICCLLKIFDELVVFPIALRAEQAEVSNRSPTLRHFLEVLNLGISVELAHPFPLEKYGLTASITREKFSYLFGHSTLPILDRWNCSSRKDHWPKHSLSS